MSDSFLLSDRALSPAPEAQRTVLVTGAAGRIGGHFLRHAPQRYELTCLVETEDQLPDVRDVAARAAAVDLGDLERLKEHCAGVDTVVHLAARPSPSQTWQPLLESNVIGTYNAFVAAHAAGCRRVVFASSIHAVSGYGPDRQVQTDDPVSPGDLYGVTKCFGEAMGRFMATQHGLSVICVRIGAFQPREKAEQADSVAMMNAFVSQRDLNQLLVRCIDDEHIRFAIFHGLSNNRFNRMNIAEAKELVGYRPEDDFTEEHPALRELDLAEQVRPHNERTMGPSGIREEAGPPKTQR
jgi:nucleoside-diphosphate-sugar epimerase